MTAHRYDPFVNFEGLHRLQEEFGRLIDGDWLKQARSEATKAGWRPTADTIATVDEYQFILDLPGVLPASVEVSVQRGVLTVSGSREAPPADANSAEYPGRRERVTGRFERRFDLPDDIDATGIHARGDLGVLTITVPRGRHSCSQKINIAWNE